MRSTSRAARRQRPASTANGDASPPASATSGDAEATLKARTVRIWSVVHTWSSLVSTVFLLLLCLTGLPLIFHHEIDEALGYAPQPESHAGRPRAPVQQIVQAALAADAGRVMQYISWDKDEPGIVLASPTMRQTAIPMTRRCGRSMQYRRNRLAWSAGARC
jgi:uncharacterized iron-regulated membrane protein